MPFRLKAFSLLAMRSMREGIFIVESWVWLAFAIWAAKRLAKQLTMIQILLSIIAMLSYIGKLASSTLLFRAVSPSLRSHTMMWQTWLCTLRPYVSSSSSKSRVWSRYLWHLFMLLYCEDLTLCVLLQVIGVLNDCLYLIFTTSTPQFSLSCSVLIEVLWVMAWSWLWSQSLLSYNNYQAKQCTPLACVLSGLQLPLHTLILRAMNDKLSIMLECIKPTAIFMAGMLGRG